MPIAIQPVYVVEKLERQANGYLPSAWIPAIAFVEHEAALAWAAKESGTTRIMRYVPAKGEPET